MINHLYTWLPRSMLYSLKGCRRDVNILKFYRRQHVSRAKYGVPKLLHLLHVFGKRIRACLNIYFRSVRQAMGASFGGGPLVNPCILLDCKAHFDCLCVDLFSIIVALLKTNYLHHCTKMIWICHWIPRVKRLRLVQLNIGEKQHGIWLLVFFLFCFLFCFLVTIITCAGGDERVNGSRLNGCRAV